MNLFKFIQYDMKCAHQEVKFDKVVQKYYDLHIQVAVQNIKMTLLSKPTHPNMAIKIFAYTMKIFILSWQKKSNKLAAELATCCPDLYRRILVKILSSQLNFHLLSIITQTFMQLVNILTACHRDNY